MGSAALESVGSSVPVLFPFGMDDTEAVLRWRGVFMTLGLSIDGESGSSTAAATATGTGPSAVESSQSALLAIIFDS